MLSSIYAFEFLVEFKYDVPSKEATNKDTSLKTQLLLSTGDEKKPDTEKKWNNASCFGDQTVDFTINKTNFLENTLVYSNQRNVTPVKGNPAVYLDYVILGQLIPARNNPKNIEEYECLPNEANLVVSLCNVNSSQFLGLEKCLDFLWSGAIKTKHFFHIKPIKLQEKPNQTCFIPPPKKYYLTYSVEPALKNIKIFCSNNEQDKKHKPSFFTSLPPLTAVIS